MSDSFPKGQSECISAKGWDSFSTQSLLPKKKKGKSFQTTRRTKIHEEHGASSRENSETHTM